MSPSDTQQSGAEQPPTSIGSKFRISDLGTDDGGVATSPIRRAFEDCFGELALIVEDENGAEKVYSFDGTSPIYCCHVPDDAHDPEEHGPQTIGLRYSYQFMRDIGADNPIRVVEWDETRFPDVAEVLYP